MTKLTSKPPAKLSPKPSPKKPKPKIGRGQTPGKAQAFYRAVLQRADKTYRPGELTPQQEQTEGRTVALLAAGLLGQRLTRMELMPQARLRDRLLYAAMLEAVEKDAPWLPTEVHYRSRSAQPNTTCGMCAFYRGEGGCAIVLGRVEALGTCRLHLYEQGGEIREGAARKAEQEAKKSEQESKSGSPLLETGRARLEDEAQDGARGDAATTTPKPHRIIRYQGLDLGITHDPGERRFPTAPTMTCCYGHIRRSFGASPDGMALDVYLSPEFHPQVSYPLFKVIQRDPRTGEPDEPKYMIGFETLDEARDAFTAHAGWDRLGIISEIDGKELDAYRADGVYHADGCGCDRCQGRTKRRKGKASRETPDPDEEPEGTLLGQGWGWLGPLRQDDRTGPDVFDHLRDRLLTVAGPQLETWVRKVLRWIVGQGSLEAARNRLWLYPDDLLRSLGYTRFERSLYQGCMIGHLYGRSQVADEVAAELTEAPGVRQDAAEPEPPENQEPYPDWLRQEFREAVRYFSQKVAMPRASYKTLGARYHDWAFSIAQMTRADLLEATRWLLERALREGTSLSDFERDFQRLVGRRGWTATGHRLYTIFDTNIRGAYGAGRFEQMTDPEVLDVAPYWIWRWRDSPNPRLNHQALHNKAIPADHPFWRSVRIPAGYGCRCSVYAATEDFVKRRGYEILLSPPDPRTIADPGFREPFSTGTVASYQDQALVKRRMQRYSPSVRRALNEELRRSQTL